MENNDDNTTTSVADQQKAVVTVSIGAENMEEYSKRNHHTSDSSASSLFHPAASSFHSHALLATPTGLSSINSAHDALGRKMAPDWEGQENLWRERLRLLLEDPSSSYPVFCFVETFHSEGILPFPLNCWIDHSKLFSSDCGDFTTILPFCSKPMVYL